MIRLKRPPSLSTILAGAEVMAFVAGAKPVHAHAETVKTAHDGLVALVAAGDGTLQAWSVPMPLDFAHDAVAALWIVRYGRKVNRLCRRASLAEPFQVRAQAAPAGGAAGGKSKTFRMGHETLLTWERLKRETGAATDEALLERALASLQDDLVPTTAGERGGGMDLAVGK